MSHDKSHQYPLEQLVTIKKKKLEEAEKVLYEKKKALEKEEEKLRQVESERDKVKDHRTAKLTQLRAKLDEGTTTDKIQQMKQYLKLVDEELKQKEIKVKNQQKVVALATEHVEAARADMFKKQQAVEKLSLHRKDWDKEMLQEQRREEDLEGDEIGSATHGMKKKGKSSSKKNHRH
jgi:hypothetical protein